MLWVIKSALSGISKSELLITTWSLTLLNARNFMEAISLRHH